MKRGFLIAVYFHDDEPGLLGVVSNAAGENWRDWFRHVARPICGQSIIETHRCYISAVRRDHHELLDNGILDVYAWTVLLAEPISKKSQCLMTQFEMSVMTSRL